ncbi:LysR family transcriptional regulator [bacterium SCSIO 12643]|nr:LysR family transcriptional regulator [bacterium SCSIO 12643]
MENTYHIKSRFWISSKEGTYLGEGRVRLLQAIDKNGSISAASKELNISYRKAWKMIDIMNSQAKSPLVERQTGGKKGGGTVVTKEGKKAIASYLVLKEKCNAFMDQAFAEMDFND